ncbi:TetR/AcrR family transcriptional regulator [Acinetobacter puyangensis]|uniref:TetR/AcrR family transcriptional regulator n=1 Tax=Acinetobacter puyangensis TaxID=1096779 RepID=UPI003A4D6645
MSSLQQRKTYHVGNLEEQIILDAKKMLEQVGVHKLSIRAVAEHIGISATAIYYHFSNKDELLNHLAMAGFKQLEKELKCCLSNESDEHPLKKIGKGYLNFASQHPALYQLMFSAPSASLSAQLVMARKNAYQVFENCIADMLGERANPKSIRTTALAGWSFTHGLSSLVIHDALDLPRKYSNDELIERTFLGLEQFMLSYLGHDQQSV